MYIQGSPEFEHHVKTYGPHKEFGYKDFIPMFTAEKFDPEAWANDPQALKLKEKELELRREIAERDAW